MKLNLYVLALLVFSFLSACQKAGQSITTEPVSPNKGTAQGPSDGGGGDTCNGKMIESYKVDITQLKEFKSYIEPLISKINVADSDQKNQSPFSLSAKIKNWYIIDCKLQDIPKERKGLYLETYQTALHTSREIFIDSNSYNTMALEEKAKLLLHEMIMSLYLIKYLSINDICKISESCSNDYSKVNNWKMFRPEPYRALNQEDHQKIRNVTAWIWLNKDNLSKENFYKILKNNDFDSRFDLSGSLTENTSQETQVDPQTIVRMLKKHQWSKSFPQFCNFDENTQISLSSCTTELVSDIRDYNYAENIKIKQLYIKIKLTRNSDQKVLEQEFTYPLTNESQKISLHISNFGKVVKAAVFSLFANWPNSPGVELKEGLKSQTLFMMLNMKNLDNPEIFQIMYQTYVWYSFEDIITEKDGIKSKETYGYLTLIPKESENLFIENELLFKIDSFTSNRTFIRSALVTP